MTGLKRSSRAGVLKQATLPAPKPVSGRCGLCGFPAKPGRQFCHAHSDLETTK